MLTRSIQTLLCACATALETSAPETAIPPSAARIEPSWAVVHCRRLRTKAMVSDSGGAGVGAPGLGIGAGGMAGAG